MPDREKVVKGLECCSHTDGKTCIYCPYNMSDTDCSALMSMDVLALLKEQETVNETVGNDMIDDGYVAALRIIALTLKAHGAEIEKQLRQAADLLSDIANGL